MARTPAQALATANSITKGYGGLCLQFVRTCYGIGAKYPSAISAWNNARYKHRTSSTSGIPVGAPIYFSGSKYGHIAVYAGNGYMRTTNSATNRIHTMTVASWIRMGYKLLGWTEDLNGVRVFSGGGSKPNPAPSGGLALDGFMGPATIKKWQQVMGTKADGVISTGRGGSDLVRKVQQHLNAHGHRLAVDGFGIFPNTSGSSKKTQTQAALQRYLGTPADGYLSRPSAAVVALQKRLNEGRF